MSLLFDGTGDYAQSSGTYGATTQLCVSFWIYRPTSHGDAQFDRIFEIGGFQRGDNTGTGTTHSAGIGLEAASPTSDVVAVIWDNSNTVGTNFGQSTTSLDAWHHVLICSNTTGPLSTFYLDGSSVGTNTTTARNATADRYTLAARNDAPANNQSNVRIAELAIWEGVILSAEQASALASGVSPLLIAPANLSEYRPLAGRTAGYKPGTLTVTNAVISTLHPRIAYPHSPIIFLASAADVTAPTLTNPTGTNTGATTASGTVDTDEGNGTLYWIVDQSATPPSVAQIQAGQDSGGAAADASGNQAVSGTGTQNVSATGLVDATTYYFHFQHQDAATNDSTVVSSTSFTTGATFQPAWARGSNVILGAWH